MNQKAKQATRDLPPLHWVRVALLSVHLSPELLHKDGSTLPLSAEINDELVNHPVLGHLLDIEDLAASPDVPPHVDHSVARVRNAIAKLKAIEGNGDGHFTGYAFLLLLMDLQFLTFREEYASMLITKDAWAAEGANWHCRVGNPMTGDAAYWPEKATSLKALAKPKASRRSKVFAAQAIVLRNLTDKCTRIYKLALSGQHACDLDYILFDDVLTTVIVDKLNWRNASAVKSVSAANAVKGSSSKWSKEEKDAIVKRVNELRAKPTSLLDAANTILAEFARGTFPDGIKLDKFPSVDTIRSWARERSPS